MGGLCSRRNGDVPLLKSGSGHRRQEPLPGEVFESLPTPGASATGRAEPQEDFLRKITSAGHDADVEGCAVECRALEKRFSENLQRIDTALKRVVENEVKLTKMRSINGLMLYVVDGALPDHLREHLYSCMSTDNYKRTEFDRPETKEFRHHVVDYNVEKLRSTQLFDVVDNLVKVLFFEEQEVYRIYTNAVMYGDVAFMHRDCETRDHVSVIVYPNPTWAPELGGETMFYDEDGEVVTAIEPRPGRIALFHGNIQHKGSPPSRLFWGCRYTTAFKYAPPDSKGKEEGTHASDGLRRRRD